MQQREEGQAKLERAYDVLEQESPGSVSRAIRWLRNPRGKWVRLLLGIVIVLASLIGPVVPVLGIEFAPIGLLLIAQDIPPLRKPVANMTLWLERHWLQIRERRRQRKESHGREHL